jgi:WD40 repeat protein
LDGEYVVSGGSDGYIRLWRLNEIDQAEGDDQLNFFANCVKEVLLQDADDVAHINQIQKSESFWIVGDAKGKVWKVDLPDFEKKEVVYRTNSGKLYDMATAPTFNATITVGQDGAVRLWDFVNKRQYYERKFQASATCCDWLPYTKRNCGRVVAVGYTNGIVRFLLLNTEGFFLLKAMKVHPHAIQMIKVSKDGGFIAVISVAGDIFLLQTSPQNIQNIDPFCLYETKLQITDVCFDNRGEKLLVGCKDGNIHEIRIPRTEEIDNSETYLTAFAPRSYTIKMMES